MVPVKLPSTRALTPFTSAGVGTERTQAAHCAPPGSGVPGLLVVKCAGADVGLVLVGLRPRPRPGSPRLTR